MPARPSTSGGPNPKASAFLGLAPARPTAADKRMSKDDMYLTGYPGQRKKGLQPYRIGARGGLPTPPESSPDTDYPALSPPMSLPGRMHTPDTLRSGEIPIGMALGSPAHPPEALPWESQRPAGRQPLTPPDLYQNATAPVQRQKHQRKKLFGVLFGRKKEDQPRESLERAELGTKSGVTTTYMASQPFGDSTPVRSNTLADRKAPRYKPIIIRSNTMPVADSPAHESRSRPQRSQSATAQPASQHSDYQSSSSNPPVPSSSALGSGPLLNIEIPSIKMERYSVMFSNVLNTQATSSSLLARRQATLEKLSTISERILHAEEEKDQLLRQRRATSPQPAKSPGFTLFPPVPSRQHPGPSPLAPRRLARSNTSPALLPSPSKPAFNHTPGPHKDRKTVTVVSPASMPEPRNPIRAGTQPERTIPAAEAESFQFGPEVSALVLDSPQSTDTEDEPVVDAHPLRPAVPEPEWTMIVPSTAATIDSPNAATTTTTTTTTTTSSASSTTTRRSPSSSASSVHTHVTRPSVDDVADRGQSSSGLNSAVEISIARQISLSRQQRSLLLRPLKTDVAAVGQPGRARTVAREEGRVVETKTGTPTEVHVLDAHPAAQRRSEWVVLDGL